MRPNVAAAATALVVLAAWCKEAENALPCAFGEDRVVAAAGARVEALDVDLDTDAKDAATSGPGADVATVVWSERAGAFARALDPDGAPVGDAIRLGPACDGGIAVARIARAHVAGDAPGARRSEGDEGTRDVAFVACLRLARPAKDIGGGLSVYAIGADGAVHLRWQGGRGPTGVGDTPAGVALAVGPGRGAGEGRPGAPRARVLWQDGGSGVPRILRLTLPVESNSDAGPSVARTGDHTDGAPRYGAGTPPTEDPEVASTAGVAGGSPGVLAHGRDFVETWAEVAYDRDGETVGRLMVSAAEGHPREVALVRFGEPAPRVLWQPLEGGGRLLLGYRDARHAKDRARLHLLALAPDLKPRGRPSRVARANGPGGPSLGACGRALIAAAPRTYYRDVLIGVTRVDAALRREGGEQQLYEDGRRLALAALRCLGEGAALLVLGEHATSAHPEARVRATTVRCETEEVRR